MSASPFLSFLGTPILFFTVQVRCGLPILGDREALVILRETWLQAAARDQWLVGLYRVRPDQVSLLACSGRTASPATDWTELWKATAAVRIKTVIGGRGPLWESGAIREHVESESDYKTRCATLVADPGGPVATGAGHTAGYRGMQWQLRPDG